MLYEKVVTEADGWKWRFAELPKRLGEAEVVYTIAEAAVAGYTSAVDGYNVTNTVVPPEDPVVVKPTGHDPPVEKRLTGDTPPSPADFVFVLAANDESYPMPDGKFGGSKEMTITGAGFGEFGWIEFAKEGTYEYTVTEKNTGVAGYTYDTSTYLIRYVVTNNNGQLEATRTFYKDGQVVEGLTSAVFTNDYRVTSDVPPTPTTTTTPPPATTTTTTTTTAQPTPRTADPMSYAACAVLALLGLALVRRK